MSYHRLSLGTPWNHLWKPIEYKEKNHAKHAEKYQLHPDEYKPYDPYKYPVGDYPALPLIGSTAKDPYYPYDNPVYKKNYHEPVRLYICTYMRSFHLFPCSYCFILLSF